MLRQSDYKEKRTQYFILPTNYSVISVIKRGITLKQIQFLIFCGLALHRFVGFSVGI